MRPASSLLVALATTLACSASSRLAPIAEIPEGTLATRLAGTVVVPFPPPPAQVETVAPLPANVKCVWVDGQWVFEKREYVWQKGAWVIAPAGCRYARSSFFWDDSRATRPELRYRLGRWVTTSAPFSECPAPSACGNSESLP